MSTITISILGAGNVAWHLYQAFTLAKDVELTQVYNRSTEALQNFNDVDTVTDISKLKPVDIFIIAVNDDSIIDVALQLSHTKALVVHTSGAKSIEVLSSIKRTGVFYPLQTFTKGVAINISQLPICIEATNETEKHFLKQLALKITNNVYEINSEQRKTLHLSAVFVNNFSNYMNVIAESLCTNNNVPFKILHELIKETARKATINSPQETQTGPAKRGDISTIQQHINQLEGTEYQNLYKIVTSKILKNYGKEL